MTAPEQGNTDPTDLTSFDVSDALGTAKITIDAKNASNGVKVNASQLDGENALTITGAESLTVVADNVETWAPKSLPEGVETLTIMGTGSVDLSGVTAFNLAEINTKNAAGVSGDQTVILNMTQFAKIGSDTNGLTVNADADDIISLSGLIAVDGTTSGGSTIAPTATFNYTLDLGNENNAFEPASKVVDGTTLRAQLMDATTGATVIGGKGADYIEYAHKVITGNALGDDETVSSDEIKGSNLYALKDLAASRTESKQVISDDDLAHLFEANVVLAHGVEFSKDATPQSVAAPQSIEVVCSDTKDTLVIMAGDNHRGDAATGFFRATPSMNITTSGFGSDDSIMLFNQTASFYFAESANATLGTDGVTAIATVKLGSTDAPGDNANTLRIGVNSDSGALTKDTDGNLVINWGQIGTSIANELNNAGESVTVSNDLKWWDHRSSNDKPAGSEGTISDGSNALVAGWSALAENYEDIKTTITFNDVMGKISVDNAYLEINIVGTKTTNTGLQFDSGNAGVVTGVDLTGNDGAGA